jgi:hypothetical protein
MTGVLPGAHTSGVLGLGQSSMRRGKGKYDQVDADVSGEPRTRRDHWERLWATWQKTSKLDLQVSTFMGEKAILIMIGVVPGAHASRVLDLAKVP